jgi:HK97 gp10 family phage protein
MIDVKVLGLNALLRNVKKRETNTEAKIKRANKITSMNIVRNAKRNAPTNKRIGAGGRLRSAIVGDHSGKEANVEVKVKYAPYVEFGTGAFARDYLSSKDKDLRDYAMEFYVNGQGRMPSQPFLFPAAEEEKPKHIKRMKEALT